MKTWRTKMIVQCVFMFVVLSLLGCSALQKTMVNADEAVLEITIFNIGKADSMLLTIAGKTVLIDTGEDEDGAVVLEYLHDKNIDSIDYMILTHFDKDHVGGADTIINHAKVSEVFVPNYEMVTKEYKEYVAALIKNNLTPRTVTNDFSFQVGSAEVTVYPPQQSSYLVENDYSLVVSVQHGANSFLFTGDAEQIRLVELMQQGNLEHTLLKVPHHGKYNLKNVEFFSRVKPEYAVITSKNKNLEEEEVVDALESLGAEIYLTRNGTIHIKSSGENIHIEQ